MTYISETLRFEVIERAKHHCEYCLVHQHDRFYPYEVDHIIPEKHRGETQADNLCLACPYCNRHKGSDFASFDPETGAVTLLFHPRQQVWDDHFRLEEARIIPLSPEGRVTVFILKVNDESRVQERRMLQKAGRYPSKPNS
jgi:hypothetical protein